MPRAYPRPWSSTGHGSLREISAGYFELRWRPAGAHGPNCRRRIYCSALEAQQFLIRQAANRLRQSVGMSPTLTWKDQLPRYEQHLLARDRDPKYVQRVKHALISLRDFTDTEITAITPEMATGWVDYIAQSARELKNNKSGAPRYRGWAATANKKAAMAKPFFEFLRLKQNPFEYVERLDQTPKLKRNLSSEDYATFRAVCEPSLAALCDFLLLTGCRFGEAAGMKRGDVSGDGVWVVTKRKRNIPLRLRLPLPILEIVIRQPLRMDGLVWSKAVDPSPDRRGNGWVIDGSQPIDSSWMKKCIEARCKKAKVDYFRPHDLRHAAGTWAVEQGVPLPFIQALLGHTDARTTAMYAHPDGTHVSNVVQLKLVEVWERAIQEQSAKALIEPAGP